MHDETYIEIVEDEVWVNGDKVRIEPGSLFIQNGDDVDKPLRVTVTFLPDSLTIRRGQKDPEPKISPEPIILSAKTMLRGSEIIYDE